jgi:hypothetical protein
MAGGARHWAMGSTARPDDPPSIHDDLERVCADFHRLVDVATPVDLARRTSGTRWTNQQMLWHMAFGYVIVLRLLPLVRQMGRLPDPVSRAFARTLNAGTRPFHVVNYLGGVSGALVFHGLRLERLFDRIMARLHRHLDAETEQALARRIHFPVDWDPFFLDTMSLEQVYRYGTQHYDFHRTQLTLAAR